MYSEQELTKVIKAVFDQEIESGALDESIAEYVDAYLVEHPVDVTALEGQDVELNSLDATGLITGGEIVEKMSGYSAGLGSKEGLTINPIYCGIVKTGNKITLCFACEITRTDTVTGDNAVILGITIPSAIGSKLYPSTIGGYSALSCGKAQFTADTRSFIDVSYRIGKPNDSAINIALSNMTVVNTLVANTTYYARFEATFLLSDSLISE